MSLTQKPGLTFMSVHPVHQRKGYGTLLLKKICDEIDEHGLSCFVMASQAARNLYQRFRFEPIRDIKTTEGDFTSMVRPSRLTGTGAMQGSAC
jgi:GNAT superfamily N-acetyltransferase